MKLAFLFPGQGSQAVGMGRALGETYPAAREAFETADRVLGFGLSKLCWEGPEEELRLTNNAQPALLAHSIAALRVIEAHGFRPAVVAGHSLGEYSACVAAGALEYEDALPLVRRRGDLMLQAGIERPGTMAAILGLEPAQVERACTLARAAGLEVVAANYNAPGQIVISGDVEAVTRACTFAKEQGAKRALMLPVSGAFHSPLMKPAAEKLAQVIDGVTFRDPSVPIVSNAWGRAIETADDVRAALKEQLTSPVRWQQSIEALGREKVDHYVEIGTGRVLKGLLKSFPTAAPSFSFGEPGDLEVTVSGLRSATQPAAKGTG